MPNWFQRRRERREAAAWQKLMDSPPVRLQQAYWRFDAGEKARLLSCYPGGLSWPEMLRLHHLNCLELLNSDAARAQLAGDISEVEEISNSPTRHLGEELVSRLLSEESPYRPRDALIWQGSEPVRNGQPREPDLAGPLLNASLTHLGSLEVLRLDEAGEPTALGFIPFADIDGIIFHEQALFRVGRIFYEEERHELVFLPLLYSTSWQSDKECYRDGSMTQFILPMLAGEVGCGIGMGHQDFQVAEPDGQHLFGLGSLSAISFPNTNTETNRADQERRS